jgi:Protein of unknown function (DUF2550)
MTIALLAVLGVNLWVIVALLALVLARRRWVSRQPGAFKGAIRVVEGGVPGLGTRWKRGYGRWVREVLVWTKTPFLFRNELVAADALGGDARAAKPGEVRRLGKHPTVVPLLAEGGARLEIAAAAGGRDQATGPFAGPGSRARNAGRPPVTPTGASSEAPGRSEG